MKLGGTTFIHNGVEHDYCFEESIRSLLGVCDEVVVVEAASTDDTLKRIQAINDPKIKIVSAPWLQSPLIRETNTDWTKDLAELARSNLTAPMNLYLQGDEVLHEEDYPLIRTLAAQWKPRYFQRLNFWLDDSHLAPHGHVCGHRVCRLAPSDRRVIWGSESLEDSSAQDSDVRIFHYGFIRKGEGFRKKSEIMGKNFIGAIDPIIYNYEKEGPMALKNLFKGQLIPYTGSHPSIASDWLKEREYLHMSETGKYTHLTQPFLKGNVVDIGSQGWPVVPWAIQVELPEKEYAHYTSGKVLDQAGVWRGDGRVLPFKDGMLDGVYSSHLLEDFNPWAPVLTEWIRVLKPGGHLVILVPEEDLWNHAVANGQPPNDAHKHCGRVGELTREVKRIAPFEVLEDRLTNCHPFDYSILFVGRKL